MSSRYLVMEKQKLLPAGLSAYAMTVVASEKGWNLFDGGMTEQGLP